MSAISRFRQFSQDRRDEFIERGLPARYFFSHRAYYLPKCGPDAFRLARTMCGGKTLDGHVELLLYADPAQLEEFPQDIFFDDDVIWHRQQFGRSGHVAFAYLFREKENLYCLNLVSDLVQRISRRREYKTRVETRFRGWHHMLLNSILNFAVENGVEKIYTPVSTLVMAHSDKTRTVQKELFERVYDRVVNNHFSVTRNNNWWIVDVQANRQRLVVPQKREEELPSGRTICICHDIERGFGHARSDSERAKIADRLGRQALADMIRCEDAAGVKATYNILGCLFNEVRTDIENGGHCLGFHSYNHAIRKYWRVTQYYWRARRLLSSVSGGSGADYADQLYRCRLVDRRVRGFRLPQSRVTAEWSDRNLIYRNFEWCGTSVRNVGGPTPVLENGLVKIPIQIDDFPMYKARMPFLEWEERVVHAIGGTDFLAFGLHDCYADLWLPHYRRFLDRILELGRLKTLDAVADEILFAHAM